MLKRTIWPIFGLLTVVLSFSNYTVSGDVWTLSFVGFGLVGSYVAWRVPKHVTGRLMIGLSAVSAVTDSEALEAIIPATTWVGVAMPLLMGLFLLTFPAGRLSFRWWRPIAVAALGVTIVGVFVAQATGDEGPFVIVPLIAFVLGAVVDLTGRYRQAVGFEKAQMRYVVFATIVAASLLVLPGLFSSLVSFDLSDLLYDVIVVLGFTLVPLAVGGAILRYRLYDIDRLISRTLAYTLVVATLSVAYLGVILGVGALATALSPTDTNLPIPIVATALVALGFQPVRKRALRVADRLVFGKQRTPYEALAGINQVELDQLLPRIAQLVTESTAAQGAVVWMSTGTDLEPAAVFPEGTKAVGPIPLDDGQVPRSPVPGEVFPLLHQGSLLGAITTVLEPGEELPALDVRLLKDLASHAATTINGVLEATPLPDGIVTFLMTDIEGSTRLWEEDPERMAVALRKHDELVQRLIREGGGVLVKWKGEGDSTFSVFPDPAEAVEAAMALQEAIKGNQWDLMRPISIRAALHTGEAELRERDYYGQTVNRCARIRSLVRGGQTLVSAATRELARSAAPETLLFNDLGEHELRDFKDPERIYEVIAQTGTVEPKQAAEI